MTNTISADTLAAGANTATALATVAGLTSTVTTPSAGGVKDEGSGGMWKRGGNMKKTLDANGNKTVHKKKILQETEKSKAEPG